MAKNTKKVEPVYQFNHLSFETSQAAWEGLNENMFTNPESLGCSMAGGAMYGYDLVLVIKNPKVEPNFNFARMFNYHDAKWIMLQNNYLDIDELKRVKNDLSKRDFKPSSHFTHTLRFHNKKDNGKECLISLTISKRHGSEKPVLIMHTRAIEITKRFLLDLLLVQRIGEFLLGKKEFTLQIYTPFYYQDADTFTMYHTHHNLHNILEDPKIHKGISDMTGKWVIRVMKSLLSFTTTPLMDIKYKVNRRCAKQLQLGKDGLPLGSGDRKMLAKDLKLRLK